MFDGGPQGVERALDLLDDFRLDDRGGFQQVIEVQVLGHFDGALRATLVDPLAGCGLVLQALEVTVGLNAEVRRDAVPRDAVGVPRDHPPDPGLGPPWDGRLPLGGYLGTFLTRAEVPDVGARLPGPRLDDAGVVERGVVAGD